MTVSRSPCDSPAVRKRRLTRAPLSRALQRGAHRLDRGRSSRPDLKGRGALVQEHGPTLTRPAAAQIEVALVRSQPGRGWEVGGRRVHDEVYPGDHFPHLIHPDRPAALNL